MESRKTITDYGTVFPHNSVESLISSYSKLCRDSLNNLQGRVESLKGSFNTRYALFSLSGFSDKLKEYCKENGIYMFDLDVLVGKSATPTIE